MLEIEANKIQGKHKNQKEIEIRKESKRISICREDRQRISTYIPEKLKEENEIKTEGNIVRMNKIWNYCI